MIKNNEFNMPVGLHKYHYSIYLDGANFGGSKF